MHRRSFLHTLGAAGAALGWSGRLLAAPQTARARVIDGLLVRQKRWEMEVLGWTVAS